MSPKRQTHLFQPGLEPLGVIKLNRFNIGGSLITIGLQEIELFSRLEGIMHETNSGDVGVQYIVQ